MCPPFAYVDNNSKCISWYKNFHYMMDTYEKNARQYDKNEDVKLDTPSEWI